MKIRIRLEAWHARENREDVGHMVMLDLVEGIILEYGQERNRYQVDKGEDQNPGKPLYVMGGNEESSLSFQKGRQTQQQKESQSLNTRFKFVFWVDVTLDGTELVQLERLAEQRRVNGRYFMNLEECQLDQNRARCLTVLEDLAAIRHQTLGIGTAGKLLLLFAQLNGVNMYGAAVGDYRATRTRPEDVRRVYDSPDEYEYIDRAQPGSLEWLIQMGLGGS